MKIIRAHIRPASVIPSELSGRKVFNTLLLQKIQFTFYILSNLSSLL